MFSVCADVFGIFGVRDVGVSFDYCIATTSGCVVSKRGLAVHQLLYVGDVLYAVCYV